MRRFDPDPRLQILSIKSSKSADYACFWHIVTGVLFSRILVPFLQFSPVFVQEGGPKRTRIRPTTLIGSSMLFAPEPPVPG